ncbi:MAG: hypothetical protein ACMUHY_05005 [Thermoplasmatota archaeon]
MEKYKQGYMTRLPYRASAIIGRTTRDIFLSRSILFSLFFLLVPSFISIYSLVDTSEDFKEWWDLFSRFGLILYLQILVLLYSLIYGSSMANEDIENRTMTYLIIRGARKGEVYICKYIGTVISLMILFTISISSMFLILSGHGPLRTMFVRTDILLALLISTYIGIIVFTALFSLFGVLFKRPLMIGLLYAFFWEIVMVNIPFNIQYLTIMHYLRSVFSGTELVEDILGLERMVDPVVSGVLMVMTSIPLIILGAYALSGKDIT